jgi:uncharacterized delta-60 repeat protein
MRFKQQLRQSTKNRQHLRPRRGKAAGFCHSFLGILLLATLALASSGLAWAVDGAIDPSFDPGVGVQQIPIVRGRVNYEDGTNRYLLYGYFTSMNGQPCNSLARFSSAGVLDTSFNPPINGEVRQAVILESGNILVCGKITVGSGGSTYYNLARLSGSDGSVDGSFYQTLDAYGLVNTIGVQSDGKLLVGGWSVTVLGDAAATYHLLRLWGDGSLDATYPKRSAPEGLVNSVAILNDDPANPNRAQVFGSLPNFSGSQTAWVVVLYNNGATQLFIAGESFNGPVYSYAIQDDGKVVYVGNFTQVMGVTRKRIARINTNGTLDTYFDPGDGPNGRVSRLVIQADGKIVVAGNFNRFGDVSVGYIARLHTNGTLDSTFTGAADDRIFRLTATGANLNIYGSFRFVNGSARGGVAILDVNGGLTGSYAKVTNGNDKPSYVYAVATQADGKVLVGGDFTGVRGKFHHGLARLNPDGSLDTTVNSGVDGYVRSIALQADGKILLGGCFGECNSYARTSLARLDLSSSASPALDLTFNPIVTKLDGSVSEIFKIVPLSGGQIMLAGHFRIVNGVSRTVAARLNSTGSLDTGFDAQITITDGVKVRATGLAPTADGKYVVSGYVTYQNLARGWLARLDSHGVMDTAFGPTNPGTPSPNVVLTAGEVRNMALQSDGSIMIVGNFSEIIDGSFFKPQRGGIARFTAGGALDDTFTTYLGANNIVNCLAIQPNGKFIIGGYFKKYNEPVYTAPDNALRIARVLPNGDKDGAFKSVPGADNALWAITLLPGAKKAYIGGQFKTYDGVNRSGLARIFTGASDNTAVNLLLLN